MKMIDTIRHLRNIVHEAEKALSILQMLGVSKAGLALHILEGVEKTVHDLVEAVNHGHAAATPGEKDMLVHLVTEIAEAKVRASVQHP